MDRRMVRRRKSMAFRKRRRKAGDGLREACEKWLKEEACGEWLQDGLSGVLCEAGNLNRQRILCGERDGESCGNVSEIPDQWKCSTLGSRCRDSLC